ncbi:uncharacterized protein LOC110759001 isoform X1 [Prunus avium]|uniref:Uncharacterized protein LOC110759001 isoform X1 n=1 Tax=Prunus avium TaxID=42229 RepID=A0A6P5SIA8_PRUAV|nr:uncharacterized protein LOC110759001 isoform X1 [Prunus avium]XP_021816691.1 uncharacterized protein LOC110759001 isoform X1 [Prunus avium]
MASTSSPALSVSKLDFQFLSSQRNITFSKENLHQVKMPRRMSKFSGFESNGFILFSSLSGQIGEGSFPSPEATANNNAPEVQVQSSIWKWRGYSIRYQHAGNSGPALVLIHGFGANSDHWRKNIPVLAKSHRVYSIDLIGYGYSDKPNPRQFGESSFYTFETWGTQLNDFCIDVVKDEAFFICNSIGGLVGLQAAVMEPQLCKGVMLLNISLHMLHIKKQPWYGRPLIRSFQNLLRNTDVGKYFFKTVATPESVRNILCQCYHDTSQVTEELVQKILLPGLEPGAVDVFLEFICYSGGPLPEELLPQVKCPVLIGWGEKDPWEPIELGRAYGKFDSVQDFVVLPNVGHCPQDEAPDLVNPLVKSFVARHAALSASISTAT